MPENCTNLTFCDPCCGSGNFLIAAIKYGFKPENIYGFDVDSVAVDIAKRRIFDDTGFESNNIFCSDYLEEKFYNNDNTFDVIFTNPPWGKKLKKRAKSSLRVH